MQPRPHSHPTDSVALLGPRLLAQSRLVSKKDPVSRKFWHWGVPRALIGMEAGAMRGPAAKTRDKQAARSWPSVVSVKCLLPMVEQKS